MKSPMDRALSTVSMCGTVLELAGTDLEPTINRHSGDTHMGHAQKLAAYATFALHLSSVSDVLISNQMHRLGVLDVGRHDHGITTLDGGQLRFKLCDAFAIPWQLDRVAVLAVYRPAALSAGISHRPPH
jgi:hypothetical protein